MTTLAMELEDAAVPPFWLPLPPHERRTLSAELRNPEQVALRLVFEHARVIQALATRNRANLALTPSLASSRREELVEAFEDVAVPIGWLVEVAPLLAPRLRRLVDRLRRRLARSRQLTPIGRIREMDSVCVRRNGRRPGRTLLEQAGPKQVLLGVHRIERFDTNENRALVSTCARVVRRVDELVRHLDRETRRSTPAARALVELGRAAAALREHPSLAGVGGLRAGERPSNALLGDSDYRAAWRTFLLFREEESCFEDEWRALPQLWSELILWATWAHLEREGWLGLPTAIRVVGRRSDFGGLRVVGEPERRWLLEDGDLLHLAAVGFSEDRAEVRVRCSTHGPAGSSVWTGSIPCTLRTNEILQRPLDESRPLMADTPTDRHGARELVRRELAALPCAGRSAPVVPVAAIALCALDSRVWAADQHGVRDVGASCAATVVADDATKFLEVGDGAAWSSQAVGCHRLFSTHPEQGGIVLAKYRAGSAMAAVVPDTLDEYQITGLRTGHGVGWHVWTVVAAALSAAAQPHSPLPVPPLGEQLPVLVGVLTDACLDVAELTLRSEEYEGRLERLWIRGRPRPHDRRGRIDRRRSNHPDLGTAEVRVGSAPWVWTLDGEGARRIDIEPLEEPVEDVLGGVAAERRELVRAVILVGFDPKASARIKAGFPEADVLFLPPEALADGAWRFLERRRSGLPTWKDRLPRLRLEVRQDRQRALVDIVDRDALVAPGDPVEFTAKGTLTIDRGMPSLSLPVEREEVKDAFRIAVHGPPLPLERALEVNIHVRYRYGEEAFEGELRPTDPNSPVGRIRFSLGASGPSAMPTAPVGPPSMATLEEADASIMAPVFAAALALSKGLQGASTYSRKAAARQASDASTSLGPLIRQLRAKLDEALAEGHRTASSVQLTRLETEVLPLLDWLLGLRVAASRSKRTPAGSPPKLSSDVVQELVRCRACAGVRGSGAFAEKLAAGNEWRMPPDQLMACRGRSLGDVPDRLWVQLLHAECASALEWGAWSRAVDLALRCRPAMREAVSEVDAHHLLRASLDQLDRFVLDDAAGASRYKGAIYRLLHLVTSLTLLRDRGLLPPNAPEVREAIDRLERLDSSLPDEVRTHAERGAWADQDAPIRTAIDFLKGEYAGIARGGGS